jgi:acetoacetyl-CoA reductase
MTLCGKVAVVTGGLGGLGSEICRALTACGRRVVAVDLPGRPHPGEFAVEYADVADFDQCQALIARIEDGHGPIDILVNAAGITRDARLVKMERAQWDDVMRVNLDSVFNLCRLVVEGMTRRGFGRIVNISSVNAQTGQFGQTNYAAAKAGMHGFTMALARETARSGVTVNSVSPGYIDTEMTRAVRPDIREQIVAAIPVGRIGQPADIARAVAFLAADDAGYLTGVNLPVNGGLFMSF